MYKHGMNSSNKSVSRNNNSDFEKLASFSKSFEEHFAFVIRSNNIQKHDKDNSLQVFITYFRNSELLPVISRLFYHWIISTNAISFLTFLNLFISPILETKIVARILSIIGMGKNNMNTQVMSLFNGREKKFINLSKSFSRERSCLVLD